MRVASSAPPSSAGSSRPASRRSSAAACLSFHAAEEEVLVEPKLERHGGERMTVDEGSATGGQEAFVLVGKALVEQAADHQADDGVAKELEALVVAVDEGRVLV